jgi:adenylate cyclase
MNPKSLFLLDGLAYLLILCGEFERGAQLAHEVIRFNPYHRAVLHDGLWVNYLRQEQYDLAYKESLYRRRQELFWDPLILASTLGLLKRYAEGRKHAKRLLALRPDFPEKGRRLISNYVKFEEISDRIIDGLKRVGLQVN